MESLDIERERAERVAANLAAMADFGLDAMADKKPPKPVSKKPRAKAADVQAVVPTRRSARERPAVSYSEDAAYADLPRLSRGSTAGRDLDEAKLERMRGGVTSTSAADPNRRRSRGAINSGKGVRVQGGKVYDSAFGVTCHWCRQKTLESSVTCCNANCGGGRRLPTTFCSKCLLNRHGEEYEAARASGAWECPQCRGSCGPGCTCCCNCGPCRKKAGLEPTHQILKDARIAGFSNVHDYLVHQVTGETADEIAGRKSTFSWGAWLSRTLDAVADCDAGAACDGSCAAAAGEGPVAAAVPAPEGTGACGPMQQVVGDSTACGEVCLPTAAAAEMEQPLSLEHSTGPSTVGTKRNVTHSKGSARSTKRAKTAASGPPEVLTASVTAPTDCPPAPSIEPLAPSSSPPAPPSSPAQPSAASGQTAVQQAALEAAAPVVTGAASSSDDGQALEAAADATLLPPPVPPVRRSTRASRHAPAAPTEAAAAAGAAGVAGFFAVVKHYRPEETKKLTSKRVARGACPAAAVGIMPMAAAPADVGVC